MNLFILFVILLLRIT